MNYDYKEKALHIYQDNSLNLFQPFNPTTGEAFEEESTALEWLKDYVSAFYQSEPAEISATIDYEGKELSFDDEIKVAAGEFFTILIDFESKDIAVKDNLTISLSKDNELKKYIPKIKDGRAIKNIVVEETGIYNILIDCEYSADEKDKVVMHKRNAFKIEIA